MTIRDIRRKGWIKETSVGSYVSALHYADGSIGVSHECHLPRSGYDVLHAPLLQLENGHRVTSIDPITITPSILCPECGMHGFIQNGKWVEA